MNYELFIYYFLCIFCFFHFFFCFLFFSYGYFFFYLISFFPLLCYPDAPIVQRCFLPKTRFPSMTQNYTTRHDITQTSSCLFCSSLCLICNQLKVKSTKYLLALRNERKIVVKFVRALAQTNKLVLHFSFGVCNVHAQHINEISSLHRRIILFRI